MVLDHLVVKNELILEPDLVKTKIDMIMKGWTRKHNSLEYVFDDAFSNHVSALLSNVEQCQKLWHIAQEIIAHHSEIVEHLIEISLSGETPAIMLRKKLTKLWFRKAMDKTITTESLSIIQRTPQQNLQITHFQIPSLTTASSTKEPAPTNKSTVAGSESIRTNYLEFAKSLFQHYCQHLRLNHNQILAESAFNFYVNKKIAYLLGTSVNTELAKETFYHKLIQNTSLPTNYNFVSIITEINKEIEHHTQQRYPITYASKDKGKLQTLAKKHRIELSTNPSYHYTPGKSTKLKKEQEEEEKKKSENQEFTYQNPITKNLDIETPNFQT
ncbi:hypothetical protein G9A89_016715 [Geosiphon pyriformis]|nr:hypothetical protein G9A89_016715 [Geosiphon pyriformis]